MIPTSEDIFREDDKVYVTGAAANVMSFLKLAGNTERKISSVMIIGRVGGLLLPDPKALLKSGFKVKIIENNSKSSAPS